MINYCKFINYIKKIQLRFSRAEKEFLDSKQNLFAKMERKELLTKHLCTIIEQNELRKAKKLSELMGKLSIDTGSTAELVINVSCALKKVLKMKINQIIIDRNLDL